MIGAYCFAPVDALIANLVIRLGDTPEADRVRARGVAITDEVIALATA